MEKPSRDSAKKGILTPEQFVCLIKTTSEKNIIVGRTTGQERAVLYALAGCTGLRRKELLSLIWEDINLLADNAFIRVKASVAKNGKGTNQPMPLIVVNLLRALRAHIRPNSSVSFGKWINTAWLIRDDLTAAGIGPVDKDGNEICFHSLRNSYISFLANSQVPAKVVQKLARHSDPRLTFNTYARTLEEAEQKALNFLPNFGSFVLSTSLDTNSRKREISVDVLGHKNGKDTPKNAVFTSEIIAPRGFEPLLPG